MCNLHNPHHTGHIENYKQHTADLQLVALFPSHLGLIQTTILRHSQTLQERARDDASGLAKAFRST